MMSVNKRTLKYNRMAKQAGMTLIELTVVLLILVGLAGLLVPYVGSFNEKTNDTANSSNLNALSTAFNRYYVEKSKLPSNLDTLLNSDTVDSTTATGGCARSAAPQTGLDVYCGIYDYTLLTTVNYVGTGTANDTNDIALLSLQKAGLVSFMNNSPSVANKTSGAGVDSGVTLSGVTSMNGIDLKLATVNSLAATAASVAGVNSGSIPDHLALALGGSPSDYDTNCYDFVAFGIGDNSKLIGNTLQNAPIGVNNGDDGGSPLDYYNHYAAIVKVDKSNDKTGLACSPSTEAAKFVGVVQFPTKGFENGGSGTGHLVGIGQSLAVNSQHAADRGE